MIASKRRITREVTAGSVRIGGDAPISVQSMTNTRTSDAKATIEQILRLERAGCEIVRVTVNDEDAAWSIPEIKRNINIPLVADIHFNYSFALGALHGGVDKLRINPGNLGGRDKVKIVAKEAASRNVPIRIGINAASLGKEIMERFGGATPEAMVYLASENVKLLEDEGFFDIIISLKASDVARTVKAYRLMAEICDYPLHLGVTEAGTYSNSLVKSSMGIGALLLDGIGDTVRVSITGDPVKEIGAGFAVLNAAGVRERGINVVSCPTCGRCRLDLEKIADEVQERTAHITMPLTVAVMGCAVNGPGEAREADLGIAGGDGMGLLFVKGEKARPIKEDALADALIEEIERIAAENK